MDLDKIKARLAAATPGPWRGPETAVGLDCTKHYEPPRLVMSPGNAAMITHAPTDLAALVVEVERERARLDRVRADLAACGCDCECGHDAESHDDDCERCFACRIEEAIR